MRMSGVSLIELLVTVMVSSILLTIGFPSLAAMIDSSHLTAATNSFVSSLRLTRSEAIKRNGRAVMCSSSDGLACAESGGWHQGWIIFHDANNNADVDEDESVVLHLTGFKKELRLRGNSPVSRYISYVPMGTTRMTSGAIQAGTLTVCMKSASSSHGRSIIINSTGRARVTRNEGVSCA